MIYCCEGCGFLFRRIGEVKTCPICESSRYRLATEAEALENIIETRKYERNGLI